MKPSTFILLSITLFTFLSCQTESDQGSTSFPEFTSTRVPAQEKELALEFKKFQLLGLSDTLYVDLNGNRIDEKVYFSEEKGIRRLEIIDGSQGARTRIEKGYSVGAGWENLNWVDYWALTEDTTTYQILIKDGEITGQQKVHLPFPAIILRKNESGGGLISFVNGKYMWIHQAD